MIDGMVTSQNMCNSLNFMYVPCILYIVFISTNKTQCIYRVSQEEGTKLRESVPYVKIYRYNPKHLCPKLNGYGDNGQRKVWSSGGSTHCTLSANSVPHVCPRLPCHYRNTADAVMSVLHYG